MWVLCGPAEMCGFYVGYLGCVGSVWVPRLCGFCVDTWAVWVLCGPPGLCGFCVGYLGALAAGGAAVGCLFLLSWGGSWGGPLTAVRSPVSLSREMRSFSGGRRGGCPARDGVSSGGPQLSH